MASAVAERPHVYVEPEAKPDESDRYRIYILVHRYVGEIRSFEQRMIADTSIDGIGSCIRQLRFPTEEGETAMITNDDRVGIFDRVDRRWLVNPYAVGR